jgi:Zn-dependent protease
VPAYRDFDSSPLLRLWQVVTRSFTVGTFFGVQVRMYWAAAILMPLLLLRWIGPASASAAEALLHTATSVGLLFVVIWSHEMGHIAAGWRYRIRTDLITLSPLGGVAHLNAPVATPRAELVVSLAGPAVHLVWLAVAWPLQQLVPAGWLAPAGWRFGPLDFVLWWLVTINATMLVFNLLPCYPLDGGRVLRALLARRVHPNRATLWATGVGVAGGALLVLYGLTQRDLGGAVPLVIGFACVSASLQERRAARYVPVYQQPLHDPWQTDPEAWKRGTGARRQPGWFARWRRARAERRAARQAAEQQALDREVDRILDRVHQVGMTGLSEGEKALLQRASQRRRGAG